MVHTEPGDRETALFHTAQEWIRVNDSSLLSSSSSSTSIDDRINIEGNGLFSRCTSDKHSRKLYLHRIRALMCLCRSEGIDYLIDLLSLQPTSTIYIHGAGGSCGVKYEVAWQIYSEYGSIDTMLMIGNCPFIMVTYVDRSSAITCRSSQHQRINERLGRYIYVEYVQPHKSKLLAKLLKQQIQANDNNQSNDHNIDNTPVSTSGTKAMLCNAIALHQMAPTMIISIQELLRPQQYYHTHIQSTSTPTLASPVSTHPPSSCARNSLSSPHPTPSPTSISHFSMYDTTMNTTPNLCELYPGLYLVYDFISCDEEFALIAFLNSREWHSYRFRSVQHYGHEFDYEKNSVDREKTQYWKNETNNQHHLSNTPIRLDMYPPLFHSILERMERIPQLYQVRSFRESNHKNIYNADSDADAREGEPLYFHPDQCTVNRYCSGDGIPAHVDVHSSFNDIITSLSLQADIVMDILTPDVPDKITMTNHTHNNNNNNNDDADDNCDINNNDDDDNDGNDKHRIFPHPHPTSASPILPISYSFPLFLPRRSLLILSDYARYGIYHSIQPRRTDMIEGQLHTRQTRISLTFRELRPTPTNKTDQQKSNSYRNDNSSNNGIADADALPVCHCRYNYLCDSALGWTKKDKKFTGTKKDKLKSRRSDSNSRVN